MIAPANAVTWLDAGIWLIGILTAGFLVSWLSTDVANLRRGPYILLLTVSTAGLTGAYLSWSGTDILGFLGHHAVWGVVGGVIVAVPVPRGITMLAATGSRRDNPSLRALGWEGLVYGITEGVLLSGLPALVVWHAADTAGWTGSWGSTLMTGALAILASAVMIAIHHFGYWDYRNRQVGVVILGCGLLTLSFVLTGSILAPVIGHVAMHVAGITHGVELPPHAHVRAPQSATTG